MLQKVFSILLGLFMITSQAKAENKNPSDKPTVIILLGAPGSGKGTQSVELSQHLGLPHISTGDLFRESIKNDTDLGKKAKSYLDRGALVPDELVFDILFDRISKPDCTKGYILDGFPRTSAQAHELEDTLRNKANFIIFNLKVPDEELIRRLSGRLICKKCGRIYQKDTNPPKVEGICDYCGGELYQRSDDKPEVVKERLRVYYDQTKPLEEFYKKQGLLTDINAQGSPESVLKVLEDKVKELSPALAK
jgi:adenylate kinase